jgi:hypothetical protein
MITTGSRLPSWITAGVVVIVVTASSAAHAITPLSYASTWNDGQGHTRKVSFDGGASRGKVSGTLQVDTFTLTVKGIIATDGSVSGTILRPNGTQAATFTARTDTNGVLGGSVTYGGVARPWSAPGVALPSATAP